jgi:hypothetical protein
MGSHLAGLIVVMPSVVNASQTGSKLLSITTRVCLPLTYQIYLTPNFPPARYPINPALVPMLNLLRTANPEQQHNIRRQFGHLLPPDVEYTCPTCRNKVHRKPIEAFALKALVRKVASAQGEESPRKETAPIAGRSRKRGARAPPARRDPFSQFFP